MYTKAKLWLQNLQGRILFLQNGDRVIYQAKRSVFDLIPPFSLCQGKEVVRTLRTMVFARQRGVVWFLVSVKHAGLNICTMGSWDSPKVAPDPESGQMQSFTATVSGDDVCYLVIYPHVLEYLLTFNSDSGTWVSSKEAK